MEQNLNDIYDLIEHAIEDAFRSRMNLKFYEYLKDNKIKKYEIDAFIESSAAVEISETVMDLEDYLEGGSDEMHKQIREAYGYLGKPEARKIKNFLQSIIADACQYEYDKKPGRKKRRPTK